MKATANSQAKRYGPVMCTHCQLGRPAPDSITQVFLREFSHKIGLPKGLKNGIPIGEGDLVVVCNSAGCVDYRKNFTGHFEGADFRPQTTTAPPSRGGGNGNGGGGGGGGGYTGPISGGSYGGGGGGGSGKVTVGPAKPSRPTHED